MTAPKIDNIAPLACPVCGSTPVTRINTLGWRIACDVFHIRDGFIAYGFTVEQAAMKWNNWVQNYKP